MQKKFSKFKLLYPEIHQKLQDGFTYQEVINHLKDNHNLDLSPKTFDSYLYRYKKANPNPVLELPINSDNSKVVVDNAEIKTSALSEQVVDANGEKHENNFHVTSLKSLNERADSHIREGSKLNKKTKQVRK